MVTPNQVIAKARTQIGVHEVGYTNSVEYNDEYYGGKYPKAYQKWAAWCVVFGWWVFKQCGLKPNVDFPRTAGVRDFFNRADDYGMKIIPKHDIQPGDAVEHTYSHFSIATSKVVGSKVRVVAGNTTPGSGGNQRDGGGVYEKWVPLSKVKRAARPKYTKAGGGLFNMSSDLYLHKTGNQHIGKGKTITAKVSDKDSARAYLAKGKGTQFVVTETLRFLDLKPGATAVASLVIIHTKTKKVYRTLAKKEINGTAGMTTKQISAAGELTDANHRLYLRVTSNQATDLDDLRTAGLVGK
ncbi:hypothetical protein [Brevibacterium moorei]|uniref:hypothetical protein n=1 Tax=Brevibacterium moorei TaxID=2968457 RepID=UPI00211CB2B9|nr:hypothetical protein [Brevibacterium sp. 68QC2CO]MCQ9384462.1 hypothetical protein [Brevibacterium sp. 68QC2CO]